MRLRKWGIAIVALLAATTFMDRSAAAQTPADRDDASSAKVQTAVSAPAEPTSVGRAKRETELRFPARLAISANPVVGYSGLTLGWGQVHTLANGGWIPIDVAPAIRIWKALVIELAFSAMIPVSDAWGFPSFRLAVTPALRFDGSRFCARVGAPIMVGNGVHSGVQLAAGVRVWKGLYAGLVAFYTPSDAIGGVGPEIGWRFDDLRLTW
jgi:hypothetical protein